jgi:hypothetical protein
MTVIICDRFNRELKQVSVPAMRTNEGRADLVEIKRHLRSKGHKVSKIRAMG